jgi:predicted DNA-binding transcriptional regulator AlpA
VKLHRPDQGDPTASLDLERLIGRLEFQQLLGIGQATFERMLASGRMLPPIRLGKTLHRWRLGTVLDWTRAGCPEPTDWLASRR